MRKESQFNPPWWLSNRHLQTFWAPLSKKIAIPALVRDRVELSDGDFLDIDWLNPEYEGVPTVVLLHGLEGGVDSPYLRRILVQIKTKGWRAALLYWRGCSENVNRLNVTYHAGRSNDLEQALTYIRATRNLTETFLVGYSLGANVLLKWLGEQQGTAKVDGAFAVSTPFDLALCSKAIDKGFSKLYKHYLLNSLKKKMLNKFSNQQLLDLLNLTPKDLMAISSMGEFDSRINARLNGFNSAEQYYEECSSKSFLSYIRVPTVILHAEDDPFMTPEIIPNESELSDCIELRISKHGGHVGFVSEPNLNGDNFYLEDTILRYFDSLVSAERRTA